MFTMAKHFWKIRSELSTGFGYSVFRFLSIQIKSICHVLFGKDDSYSGSNVISFKIYLRSMSNHPSPCPLPPCCQILKEKPKWRQIDHNEHFCSLDLWNTVSTEQMLSRHKGCTLGRFVERSKIQLPTPVMVEEVTPLENNIQNAYRSYLT